MEEIQEVIVKGTVVKINEVLGLGFVKIPQMGQFSFYKHITDIQDIDFFDIFPNMKVEVILTDDPARGTIVTKLRPHIPRGKILEIPPRPLREKVEGVVTSLIDGELPSGRLEVLGRTEISPWQKL